MEAGLHPTHITRQPAREDAGQSYRLCSDISRNSISVSDGFTRDSVCHAIYSRLGYSVNYKYWPPRPNTPIDLRQAIRDRSLQ